MLMPLKKELKEIIITFRVDLETNKYIRKQCKERDISLTDYMRELIELDKTIR